MSQGVRVFTNLPHGLATSASRDNCDSCEYQDSCDNCSPVPLLTKENRRHSKSKKRLHVDVNRDSARRYLCQRPRVQVVSTDGGKEDDEDDRQPNCRCQRVYLCVAKRIDTRWDRN